VLGVKENDLKRDRQGTSATPSNPRSDQGSRGVSFQVSEHPALLALSTEEAAGMSVAFLRREIGAGFSAALVALPICISSGVLAYAPLGDAYIARGAVAGLTSGALAGIFAAIVASSSFVLSSPRASISLIQGSVASFLLQNSSFAHDPEMIIDAISLCGLLAGVWQMLFGVLGLDRIIKSTPHPALAGFINGIALLVIIGQLALLLDFPGEVRLSQLPTLIDQQYLAKLIFALSLAGLILYLSARFPRVPAMIVGLGVGILLFFGIRHTLPAIALGPTIGDIPDHLAAVIPLASLMTAEGREAFLGIVPALLISSLVLALVAALESLLAYRVAQNLSEQTSEPGRDVIGQGVGNLVASLLGGVASAASSAQLTANYEAGGRSRVSVLAAATLLFVLGTVLSSALGVIPTVVIWAILLAVGILLFDEWSVRSVRDAIFKRSRAAVRRGWRNHLVAVTVMVITASGAVIGGTLVGIGLSCILFIADMSRSIVRRRYRGDQVFSKRVRPADDVAVLRQTGGLRAVLELHGVMFFGNADELSNEIDGLFRRVDMLVLDFADVTDIDFSAASILRYELAKSARHRKMLLFSSLSPAAHELLTDPQSGAAAPASVIFADLDAALEWMEERALSQSTRALSTTLPIEQHGLFSGLTSAEFAMVRAFVEQESYAAGATLCREGDDADRMWMLTRGSVSVRVRSVGQRRDRRIASLAFGTFVGEIAFFESGRRTATLIADEEVECYVLHKTAYATIVRQHPEIGIKLLANMVREVTQRLRITSDELRALTR
jgi:sulfate permease, SulP family